MLARLGLAAVPNLSPIAVPHLDDQLRVMHVFPSRPAPHFRALMDTMAAELKLASSQASRMTERAEPCAIPVAWRGQVALARI